MIKQCGKIRLKNNHQALEEDCIVRCISKFISQYKWTQAEYEILASNVIETLFSIGNQLETPDDLNILRKMFSPKIKQAIKKDLIFYPELVKMFIEMNGKRKIKQASLIRIYYLIANIKKINARKNDKLFKKIIIKNNSCVLAYGYKQKYGFYWNYQDQLGKLVLYELVAQNIYFLAKRIQKILKINIQQQNSEQSSFHALKIMLSSKLQNFEQIIQIQLNHLKDKPETQILLLSKELQQFMVCIFMLNMNTAQRQLGDQIKLILKDHKMPDMQKAVALQYFYNFIVQELINNPQKMENFFTQKYDRLCGKKDINISVFQYINYIYFSSDSINLQQYSIEHARIFYLYNNISQLIFKYERCSKRLVIQTNLYWLDMIEGVKSQATINLLYQVVQLNVKYNQHVDSQHKVLSLIQFIKQISLDKPLKQINTFFRLIEAQTYLRHYQPQKSLEILEQIKNEIFEEAQSTNTVYFLHAKLTAQLILNRKLLKHVQSYRIFKKTAQMYGLQLRGRLFVQNQLKILKCIIELAEANSLLEQSKSLLQVHALNLLRNIRFMPLQTDVPLFSHLEIDAQLSNIKLGIEKRLFPDQFYGKISLYQSERVDLSQNILVFAQNKISEKQAQQHLQSTIYLNSIRIKYNSIDMVKLINLKNQELRILQINSCDIGDKGCEYVSRSQWPNLHALFLNYNNIKDLGCKNLTKANWQNLTTLYFHGNSIKQTGCRHLTKANWPQLKQLHLGGNNLAGEGCRQLVKGKWPQLQYLNIIYDPQNNDYKKIIQKIVNSQQQQIGRNFNSLTQMAIAFLHQENREQNNFSLKKTQRYFCYEKFKFIQFFILIPNQIY